MFLVISYDITDDARRLKIHQALQDYGERVQYSVFECRLNKVQYLLLRHRLKGLINAEEDSLRVYRLCQACQVKVERIGGHVPQEEITIVV